MSSIIDSWNYHISRPKYNDPDSVVLEEEILTLPREEVKMAKPASVPQKVGVNRGAVTGLALYGAQDRVETLYRECKRTLKRLKVDLTKVENATLKKGSYGPFPTIHGVLTWLEAIDRSRLYKEDRAYLKRLFKTAKLRVRPEVLEEE